MMSTLAIDKAIAKVPFLAESKDIKKIPLSGGITNLNFKIEADGKAYVIRLAGDNTNLPGIKRDVGPTQTGISKLEEDFQEYADLWFARFRQHVTDFRWEQWLKDAAKKGK